MRASLKHANTDTTHHCSSNVFLCVLRDPASGKVGKQDVVIRKHNGTPNNTAHRHPQACELMNRQLTDTASNFSIQFLN